MKPSVILYAVFLTVSLGIKAQQADTVSYEVTKNMPVFYEQLKQQLTYPAAWADCRHKASIQIFRELYILNSPIEASKLLFR